MATIDTRALMSITEAAQVGISRLAHEAENGHERILVRNNRPVAAVVSMQRLDELDDARDTALVVARQLTDEGRRTSLDDVLEKFGATREQLQGLEDEPAEQLPA